MIRQQRRRLGPGASCLGIKQAELSGHLGASTGSPWARGWHRAVYVTEFPCRLLELDAQSESSETEQLS